MTWHKLQCGVFTTNMGGEISWRNKEISVEVPSLVPGAIDLTIV
jgi:hypothetical protein